VSRTADAERYDDVPMPDSAPEMPFEQFQGSPKERHDQFQQAMAAASPHWNVETWEDRLERKRQAAEDSETQHGADEEAEDHAAAIQWASQAALEPPKTTPKPQAAAAGPTEFTSYTLRDFMAAQFPIEYLIEGVLVAGQPAIIAGAKHTLKTSVALDLCVSLATGTPFLGRFAVPRKVRCGIMSGESGEATLQETLRRICQSKFPESTEEMTDCPIISVQIPELTDAGSLDMLRRFILKNQLEVLVIDPVYLAFNIGESAGNHFVVGPHLRNLSAICRECGCLLILVHHTTKASARTFEAPELQDISWSGFSEWMRQYILLGHREKFDQESPGEHRLWLKVGGSAGHHGCHALNVTEGRQTDPGGRRWEVNIESATDAISGAKEAREQAREQQIAIKEHKVRERRRERIMDALRQCPEGETRSKLGQIAGLSGENFEPIFMELLQSGTVQPCKITKNKTTHEGFKLASLTQSDTLRLSDCVRA